MVVRPERLTLAMTILQVALEDAMELDALAGGEADGAGGLGAQIVMDEPLGGRDAASGHLAADHEAPGLFLFLLGELGAQIPVILLVAAVVLEQDVVRFFEMGDGGISQRLGDGAAEAVAGDFDFFRGSFAHDERGMLLRKNEPASRNTGNSDRRSREFGRTEYWKNGMVED